MLPKTKSNIGKGLNNVNDKNNNALNTSFETDQKEPIAEQKSTQRMRTMVHTGKTESSANIDSSQVIGNKYIKDQVSGQFVSTRYNRRRLSAIKYNLKEEPENEIRNGVDNFDVDFVSRRMSAPELPPISSNGKNSAIINNSNLTSRSNTFHNYKFSHKNRKIIHSDSSLQGFTSRASSASSQASRHRVQSAGTDRLLQTANHVVIEEPIKEKPPTQKITDRRNSKEDMPAAMSRVSRCPPAPGFRRSKSKIGVNGYNLTTPRSIMHSHSETQLNQQKGESVKKQIVGIKRINSDNKLTELNKRNARTSGAVSVKRDGLPTGKGTSNNLNGMRKYSSTLGLNSNDKQSDESDVKKDTFDSDSDTEKDSRVIEWIIGVNSVAEPPEEQVIEYADEPPQRDTAIRIVYDGDT